MKYSHIAMLCALSACAIARADPSLQPTTQPESVPAEEQTFDASEHALGDLFSSRTWLAHHGIFITPNLIVDNTQNLVGGITTSRNLTKERFNFPVLINSDPLLGYHGGTFYMVYQFQHGGNATTELVGSFQQVNANTDADGRSQLGELWYQQKFFDDNFRLKFGKIDGNEDFDVMENGQEFVNNSFGTVPTLVLMPSWPDNAMGLEGFFEPKGGFYAGAAIFNGSQAQGIMTGEQGPKYFFQQGDDLFLIGEIGQSFNLDKKNSTLPGRVGVGGWYDTNTFVTVNGDSTQSGTGGAYFVWEQTLWKPGQRQGVSVGTPAQQSASPSEEEYTGAIASTFSISWADPTVNLIDGNVLYGLTWTGMIPGRNIDVAGVGATLAYISDEADTRYPYELAIETFYRIRFTKWISLKPDLQYIIHPAGGNFEDMPLRDNALVATLRLEMSF